MQEDFEVQEDFGVQEDFRVQGGRALHSLGGTGGLDRLQELKSKIIVCILWLDLTLLQGQRNYLAYRYEFKNALKGMQLPFSDCRRV